MRRILVSLLHPLQRRHAAQVLLLLGRLPVELDPVRSGALHRDLSRLLRLARRTAVQSRL